MRRGTRFLCSIIALTAATSAAAETQPQLSPMDVSGLNQARARARDDARDNPAPDLDGLHVVLIRSLAPNLGGLPEYPADWYVSVKDADGTLRDLSIGARASLHMWPIRLMSEGVRPTTNDLPVLTPGAVHYNIDTPLRRADGNYDVSYGFYCGVMCLGSTTAVMSHDAQGWHILWKSSPDKF